MKPIETRFGPWHDEIDDQTMNHAGEDEGRGQGGSLAEVDEASANDPFGLYLRQMGAIPMLNRKDERELTSRLERLRRRYRRAALSSAAVLARVVATFEHIQAAGMGLERSIDEVPSLGLTAK